MRTAAEARLAALIESGGIPDGTFTIAATWRDEHGTAHRVTRRRPDPTAPFGPPEHTTDPGAITP